MSGSYGLFVFLPLNCERSGKFFLYSGHQSSIIYVFFRYFLSACVLCLHFIFNNIFQEADILNFHEVHFILCFYDFYILCPMKSLPNPRSQRFSHMLRSRIFIVLGFTWNVTF